MKDSSENFVSDIHTTNYLDEYLKSPLDARSLINSTGRTYESLNGKWNFIPDWYDTCRRAKWYTEKKLDDRGVPMPLDWDWEAWDRIEVPSCWNTEQESLHYFEGTGLYTRTFRYLKAKADERVFIRFEGVQYQCSVFINGLHVGTHNGGSTPFCAEVGQLLHEDNRIIVAVDACRNNGRVPMENTDWFNYGGIYRDVQLIRTPAIFIKDWFLRLSKDGDSIDADIYLSDESENTELCIAIPELNFKQNYSVKGSSLSVQIPCVPDRWSPENPKLYDVDISCVNDRVSDRIGFRSIEVRGQEIMLNGKAIFLKGISVHEDHFKKGKTTDEALIRQTIAHLKELHGNYLRLAHYPHDPRFARIADEEGIMLWAEIPVYWAIAFENKATYRDAENQLSELVLRDRNRASVIIWSVGNENADTDARLSFMSRLADKARELDGSRPISAACLINHTVLAIKDRLTNNLDIIGINEYYGWYDPDFSKLPLILENSKPDKPVLVCEFGGAARAGQRGTRDDLFTEDKQEHLYKEQTQVIGACSYIKGMSPWILYDFRCPRRLNRYQEHFNRKGLIDADRKTKKKAFYVLSAFYRDHQ